MTTPDHHPHSEEFALFDLHAHPAFSTAPARLMHELNEQQTAVLCCATCPDEYMQLATALKQNIPANYCFATGIHPWWVSCDAHLNDEMILQCLQQRYEDPTLALGEVGLDFSASHIHTKEEQLRVFTQLIAGIYESRAWTVSTPRLISIHAVRATTAVLDILEETKALKQSRCILHWFSGTSDELTRAIRLGCYFSINPAMTKTKRGQAYIKQIPLELLVLETDLPERGSPLHGQDISFLLQSSLHTIQEIKSSGRHGLDPQAVADTICRTSRQLMFE